MAPDPKIEPLSSHSYSHIGVGSQEKLTRADTCMHLRTHGCTRICECVRLCTHCVYDKEVKIILRWVYVTLLSGGERNSWVRQCQAGCHLLGTSVRFPFQPKELLCLRPLFETTFTSWSTKPGAFGNGCQERPLFKWTLRRSLHN